MTKTANFTIRIGPRYNAETEAAMQEARDIISGNLEAKGYTSAKELAEELKAELAAELEAEC